MVRIGEINDKGYFTVELLGKSGEPFCAIKDCRVVTGRNGKFISTPSRKYQKDGADKYAPYVWLNDAIQRLVIEAYGLAEEARKALETKPAYNDDSAIPF